MKTFWKRMGLKTLIAALGVSLLWGAGCINPALFEKTKDTLSTSTDIKWAFKKVEKAVNALGAEWLD